MKKLLTMASIMLAGLSGVAQVLQVRAVEKVPIASVTDLKAAAFSPAGDYLLLTTQGNKNLYRLSVADGALTTISEAEGAGYRPLVSADGRSVVYCTKRISENHLRATSLESYNVVTGEQVSLVEPTRELQGYAVAGNTAVTVEQGTARRRALSRGAAPSETATPMVYIKNRQLMLSQGNDIKTLSPNGLQESYIWPSLSPAGDKVLYYVCGVGAFVCDLSGNIVARLGALRAPQWYDNSVVVGMNDRDDGHTVVASSIVATTLTGESQTLTPDSLIAMFPQTCERAGRIAFTTADGELYMIQLEK